MEPEGWEIPKFFKFKSTAFKHRISAEDIKWAFLHPRYDGPIEDGEDKYIRIGFDCNAKGTKYPETYTLPKQKPLGF